jgi:acyl-CoA synthetase (AMP-forming)/AMP-acid ligase II
MAATEASTTSTAGLLDLLEDGARSRGTIRFVPHHPEPMPLGEVWDLAGRAGANLLERVGRGGVVGMVLSSTPEALAVLVGAWRAGLTAVSLPQLNRKPDPDEHRRLLRSLGEMTGAQLVVGDGLPGDLGSRDRDRCGGAPELATCRPADIVHAVPTGAPPEEVGSFVQFTSGSTSHPKGVRLSLRALAHNVRSMLDILERQRGLTFCSWLPLSHDMGLIGQCLAGWAGAGATFVGESHLCLIAPEAFQANPSIWLRTCSEIRATHSAVPNFGLDLAARFLVRTRNIDLSSMAWCGCGAEPVRVESLRTFAAAAAPFGFRASALSPCYGMAEASLAVTMVRPSESWSAALVDRDALALRRWQTQGPGPGQDADAVVSVGRPVKDMAVRISHGPGEDVGQIEIAGPSLLTDYVGSPSPYTPDGWVRTGDEGALGPDGDLFVLGRIDDVIVLRGRNLYVGELEESAAAHRAVRPGNCAVVADGAGRYLVVAERRSRGASREVLQDAARVIRRELVNHCGVGPSAVIFAQPRSLPRTTSGKLQRHRIRQARRDGSLPVVFETSFGE